MYNMTKTISGKKLTNFLKNSSSYPEFYHAVTEEFKEMKRLLNMRKDLKTSTKQNQDMDIK